MVSKVLIVSLIGLVNNAFGRSSSYQSQATTAGGGYSGGRHGHSHYSPPVTTYNWQSLDHYDRTPVSTSTNPSAQYQLQSAQGRASQTIANLAQLELINGQNGNPINSVYWVVEDFQDGSIKARTNQAAGGGGSLNYAQPVFRVGLDPSQALSGYVRAKGISQATKTYSVIKIDIPCVNKAGINTGSGGDIAVYTHGGALNFHLTFDPNKLQTIWNNQKQDLDQLYDQQFPLIIPQQCYDETKIPTAQVDQAIKLANQQNNLSAVDNALTSNGFGGRGKPASGGRGSPSGNDDTSSQYDSGDGSGSPLPDDSTSSEKKSSGDDDDDDDDSDEGPIGSGYGRRRIRRLFRY